MFDCQSLMKVRPNNRLLVLAFGIVVAISVVLLANRACNDSRLMSYKMVKNAA